MDVQHLGGGHLGPATTFAALPTPVLGKVADRLGISVDALRSQLAAGRPLSTVATVAGLAREELVATVTGAAAPEVPPPLPAPDSASVELYL